LINILKTHVLFNLLIDLTNNKNNNSKSNYYVPFEIGRNDAYYTQNYDKNNKDEYTQFSKKLIMEKTKDLVLKLKNLKIKKEKLMELYKLEINKNEVIYKDKEIYKNLFEQSLIFDKINYEKKYIFYTDDLNEENKILKLELNEYDIKHNLLLSKYKNLQSKANKIKTSEYQNELINLLKLENIRLRKGLEKTTKIMEDYKNELYLHAEENKKIFFELTQLKDSVNNKVYDIPTIEKIKKQTIDEYLVNNKKDMDKKLFLKKIKNDEKNQIKKIKKIKKKEKEEEEKIKIKYEKDTLHKEIDIYKKKFI